MSDTVQIASLVATLIGTMFTAYMAYLMAKLKADVREVRHETNSMKDQLVEATKQGALLQGRADERADAASKVQLPEGFP